MFYIHVGHSFFCVDSCAATAKIEACHYFGLNNPLIEIPHSFGLDADQSTHLKLLLFPFLKRHLLEDLP